MPGVSGSLPCITIACAPHVDPPLVDRQTVPPLPTMTMFALVGSLLIPV